MRKLWSGKREWKQVPGIVAIEVDGEFKVLDEETALVSSVISEIKSLFPDFEQIDGYEIDIHFRSSGYYDPGKLSGPPEKCYPADGDDERLLDYVIVSPAMKRGYDGARAKKLEISKDTLFEQFFQLVEEKELESDYEGDRGDYEYDRRMDD